MRKVILTIIVLFTLCCSGGFAQGGPNSFSIPLAPKTKDAASVSCGENGFFLVSENRDRKRPMLTFTHGDTLLQARWDTAIALPANWKRHQLFYENGAVVCLYRIFEKTHITDRGMLFIYHTGSRTLEQRMIYGLPTIGSTLNWHHYRENLFFTVTGKSWQQVWFLPARDSVPTPFPFTRENPGVVLASATDTATGNAILCFGSGGRTMYFETDFTGKASFANILDEPATKAHWVRVGSEHTLLMLYYQDDETFYMHPVNIFRHKVTPSDTVFCADNAVPKQLPQSAKAIRTIIITPYNYVSILPTTAKILGDAVAFTTEHYYPEYTSYFNGWYVEPRFNGYRFERADVHFFDTSGVFRTNVSFPYDESLSLSSHVSSKLKVHRLHNGDILLYLQRDLDMTTMVLDTAYRVKDPVRLGKLPIPQVLFGKQKNKVERFEPWYEDEIFLLTTFRINISSQKKTAFEVRKIEYQ